MSLINTIQHESLPILVGSSFSAGYDVKAYQTSRNLQQMSFGRCFRLFPVVLLRNVSNVGATRIGSAVSVDPVCQQVVSTVASMAACLGPETVLANRANGLSPRCPNMLVLGPMFAREGMFVFVMNRGFKPSQGNTLHQWVVNQAAEISMDAGVGALSTPFAAATSIFLQNKELTLRVLAQSSSIILPQRVLSIVTMDIGVRFGAKFRDSLFFSDD